jgi:hypothetical protein
MVTIPFAKTLIVWWRFGKEHGDEDIRVNLPEMIDAHVQRKVARFTQMPEERWRWWQVSNELIVERWDDSPAQSPDTRIYYLLKSGVTVIENIHLPAPDDNWKWFIQVCDFKYYKEMSYWVMKDLFCDICVEADNHSYHLFDLPDLAQALDLGLISRRETRDILHRVDWVVNQVARGGFPFPEIVAGQEACKLLGW